MHKAEIKAVYHALCKLNPLSFFRITFLLPSSPQWMSEVDKCKEYRNKMLSISI